MLKVGETEGKCVTEMEISGETGVGGGGKVASVSRQGRLRGGPGALKDPGL